MTYVVDASVILKWFVAEEGTVAAEQVRDQLLAGEIDLVAPDMLLYETAHVLLRKKGFTASEAREAVDLIFRVGLTISALDIDQISHAIDLAARAGTSVYDSCYLTLANDLNCALITADERFAKSAATFGDVRLLSSL